MTIIWGADIKLNRITITQHGARQDGARYMEIWVRLTNELFDLDISFDETSLASGQYLKIFFQNFKRFHKPKLCHCKHISICIAPVHLSFAISTLLKTLTLDNFTKLST